MVREALLSDLTQAEARLEKTMLFASSGKCEVSVKNRDNLLREISEIHDKLEQHSHAQ